MNKVRKKILVLRYRFIGDTILTIPFLRNLRRAEPEAEIVWVVAPGSSDVVHGVPYVDELLYWDPVTIHADSRGAHKTLSSKWAFIRDLRSRRFDKVYVLKRSLSSAIIAWLSAARERVGFDTEARGILLTKRVPYRHDQHEVQNFLDVLRADGVPVTDDYLEAWLTDEEKAFAANYLSSAGVSESDTVIALHPFTANPPRAWHHENFIELANRLQMMFGVKILIFGGKRDVTVAERLRDGIRPEPVLAVGTTTLRQSMALLGRCRMLVCNDSGIMHLGAAMRIPLVAVFGPQTPVKFGPWGDKCRIIYKAFPCSPCKQKFFTECTPSHRGSPRCVENISVNEVIEEVKSLI